MSRREIDRVMWLLPRFGLLVMVVVLFGVKSSASATSDAVLASVTSGGVQGSEASAINSASIDRDGSAVVFDSIYGFTGDSGADSDVFVRDLDPDGNGVDNPVTTLLSKNNADAAGNGDSRGPAISPYGRFVVFESNATNLPDAGAETNINFDIFLRDRDFDTDGVYDEAGSGATQTYRVSWGEGGALATGGASQNAVVSHNGDNVAFESDATNLHADDDNTHRDIFVRDRSAGVNYYLSRHSSPCTYDSNGGSFNASIDFSGDWVSFQSNATNLIGTDTNCDGVMSSGADTNGVSDVFLRRRSDGTTIRASVANDGSQAVGGDSIGPAPVSDDGRYVVFASEATNLIGAGNDTNGFQDIFVRDLVNNTTTRVNLDYAGAETTGYPSSGPDISPGGRYISFQTRAKLVPDDEPDGSADVYVVDRDPDGDGNFAENNSYLVRASLDVAGEDPDNSSSHGSLSSLGIIAFDSLATDLVVGDTNMKRDVFFRDLDPDDDTILDPQDNCPTTANSNQANSDSDTLGDVCDNCPTTTNGNQLNSDADTLGDACDNCPTVTNANQANSDGDTTGDVCDNCPTITNGNQANNDSDTLGDACDNCPTVTNANQANSDSDTIGDACDNCPAVANADQANADNDPQGDACEATHCTAVPNWWTSGVETDPDCDGFTTVIETDPDIATDPNDPCANTPVANDEVDDKWPVDFTDNQVANTLDLTGYATRMNTIPVTALDRRHDLNQNGVINTLDLTPYATMLNRSCVPIT